MRVDRVGLATITGGEDPHLRRQLRWDVQDGFAVMYETVRNMFPDAVTALHRPHPIRELPTSGKHLAVPDLVRAVATLAQRSTAPVDDLDRRRALVRIHPDDHTRHISSLNWSHR